MPQNALPLCSNEAFIVPVFVPVSFLYLFIINYLCIMATVKVILKSEKKKLNGLIPIYIRIISKGKVKFISLQKYVLEKDWDEDNLKVTKSDPLYRQKNTYIAEKVADAEAACLELETGSKFVTPRQIKNKVMGIELPSYKKYVAQRLKAEEDTIKIGTYRKNAAIVAKLNKYLGTKDLLFADMDVTWIKAYSHYLSTDRSNKINTIGTNLKILKKYFNEAVKEGIVTFDSSPFLNYKIKSEPSERQYLTEDELIKIENLDLTPGSNLYDHRNIFVFSTYAGGLRISDALQLKWENFDGIKINIVVKKTGEMHSIKLPEKALAIINGYIKEDAKATDFVFPVLDNSVDYSSDPKLLHNAISIGTSLCNNSLVKIAEKAKLTKKLHNHISRHSFATMALRKGIRIEYVSKLLSHNSLKTTQIYAKIINAELDDAMDVFNTPSPVLVEPIQVIPPVEIKEVKNNQ